MHTSDADISPLPGLLFWYNHHLSTAIEQTPSVSPSDCLRVMILAQHLSSEEALEDELIEAAFVIFWPNQPSTTVR